MDDIAFAPAGAPRRIKRHLLQEPGKVADRDRWGDNHPTVCGRYVLGQAKPEGDYSSYRMCGVCERVAARR